MPNVSLVNDIGDLLAANGFGIKSGTGADMFGNNMPATPDNLIALYESTGFEPHRAMGGIKVEVLNLQIIVRNLNTITGQTKARAIMAFLETFKGILNGTEYKSILARHSPFPLGADENKRERWTCNYKVDRAYTP